MYIFMAPGVISFKRKFFTSKSVSIISEILFIYLIPFYGAIEIARVGSMEILKVFWILVVNFVLSLLISYTIASICQKIFKLDERIKQSFNLVCTIPAMGALPLVIGKAFCFPGGPMEGDIYCDSMIGLMMLCYLVVCICVFLLGYILILSDKIRNNIIQEKMMFLWQILVKKSFGEDFTILYLFNKYLKDKEKSNLLYEEFKKNHGEDLINLKYDFHYEKHHHHHHKNEKVNKQFSNKIGQKSEKNIEKNLETINEKEKKKALSMKVKSINNINLSEKFKTKDENSKNLENENGKKSLKNINSNNFENESENNNNVILNDSYFMSQVSEESRSSSSSSSSSSTSSDDDSSSIKDLGSHYYHENINNENSNSRKNSVKIQNQKTFVFENKGLKDEQFCILFEQKESFYPGHHLSREIKTKFDDNTKVIQRDVFFSKSNKHLKVNIKYEIPTSFKEKVKAQNFLINHPSFKLQTHETNIKRHKSVRIPNHNFKIHQESFKNQNQNQNTNTNYLKTEELDLIIEEPNKNISEKEIILNYYQSAFDMIESDPSNFNIELITEYESMKEEILRKVHHTPPKFPIVRSAQIDSQTLDILNKEWENFEPKLKTVNQSFKGLPQGKIDNQILMAKIYAPPTLGVVIGLILSLSNLRLIIFDNKNHYWSNIVDGLNVIDKAMVAFLFLLIGLSSASTNGLSMNVPLKKKHIIIVFIMRFIIIPGIGLLVIYFWKNVYGKIVEQSLVFRIILFFPWCLPSAPNMAVIVNLTQYFFEEYGYLILLQNVSSVATLTILYLVYFILIGL